MKQSRLMSFVESCINIAVGFGISLGAQLVFLPMLGVTISLSQNVVFALIMTAISIARSYMLRRVFEALHIRNPLSPAAFAVIAERRRQIEQEGWSSDHDNEHEIGELALAGAAYAENAAGEAMTNFNGETQPPDCWPWNRQWWKPYGFRRDLVRAGALILAEIDRFDRQRKPRVITRLTFPIRKRSAA